MDPIRSGLDDITLNHFDTSATSGQLHPTVGPCGYLNNAYRFDPRQKSYLKVEPAETLLKAKDFTFIMMIRQNKAASFPLMEYVDTARKGIHFGLDSSKKLRLKSNAVEVRSTLEIPVGEWTVVGVSYDTMGPQVLFVCDNQYHYVKSGKMEGGFGLNIGGNSDGFFDGDISWVMVFQDVLTPKEIWSAVPKCPRGKCTPN
jgi:hypothetical protein